MSSTVTVAGCLVMVVLVMPIDNSRSRRGCSLGSEPEGADAAGAAATGAGAGAAAAGALAAFGAAAGAFVAVRGCNNGDGRGGQQGRRTGNQTMQMHSPVGSRH
jgi:hypothetical protein